MNDLPARKLHHDFPLPCYVACRTLAASCHFVLFGGSRSLGTVVAVDRYVLLGEIASQHTVAALAKAERDLERYLGLLHRRRNRRLVVARIALALVGDADAVEPDR